MELYVTTYGTRLSYDNGYISITLNDEIIREIALLHVSSIHITNYARISTHLIHRCVENGIPVFIDDGLNIAAIIWSPQYGSINTIRKKQTLLAYSSLKYAIVKRLLILKNQRRIQLILKRSVKPEITQTIPLIEALNQQIQQAPGNDTVLRNLEAQSSKHFFSGFRLLLPSHVQFAARKHQKAKDITNIVLNYLYGIQYKEVTKALISAGLDPYTGLLHTDQYNRPALTYDIIEQYRPWAEHCALKTLKQLTKEQIHECEKEQKLPRAVKHIIIENYYQYTKETIVLHQRKKRTPHTHMQLDAHNLAQYILHLNETKLIQNIIQTRYEL